jgi:hypothetical protein
MMNLYLVVSEPLTYVECEDASVNACHEESYCIAELVVARNRSQATYLAWKPDPEMFSDDMRDKPKFRCELKRKDVEGPARIASDEVDGDDSAWYFHDQPVPWMDVTLPESPGTGSDMLWTWNGTALQLAWYDDDMATVYGAERGWRKVPDGEWWPAIHGPLPTHWVRVADVVPAPPKET